MQTIHGCHVKWTTQAWYQVPKVAVFPKAIWCFPIIQVFRIINYALQAKIT